MGKLSKDIEGCTTCIYTGFDCAKNTLVGGSECIDYKKMPNKNQFTCFKCTDNKDCQYAWDLHNLKGDCLVLK